MATLNISKKYTITLDNGKDYKLDADTSVVNVGEVYDRTVKVPTATEVELVKVAAVVAAGTLTDFSFMVIKNEDETNTCRLRISDNSGHTFDIKLESGQAFDLYNVKFNVSETEAAFSSFSDIDTVHAQFDIADGSVSILAGQPC